MSSYFGKIRTNYNNLVNNSRHTKIFTYVTFIYVKERKQELRCKRLLEVILLCLILYGVTFCESTVTY